MEYCSEHGIPYSQFLSWSDDDQEAALSYMLFERGRCSQCGTFPEDWLKDGKPVDPTPYETSSEACLGCATLEDARKKIPDEYRHHVRVYLRPRGVPSESDVGRQGSSRL